MPEGSGLGLYPYGEVGSAENDEVSSTYEGRHLTVLGTEITSHVAGHTLQQSKHPMVVGEHIVGVAFTTETATGKTRYVAFDTQGLFLLSVVATDEDGDNAVVAGDELYIHKTTAIISKNRNTVTHTLFGYALGGVTAGNTAIITVMVHWGPDDEEELVGQQGAPFVGADASQRFREYHYEAQGGGYPHGLHIELNISTVACISAQALVAKVRWTNDTNLVGGYCAAGEFEIEIAGGAGLIDNMFCIHLTSHIGALTMTTTVNVETAWIAIDEYAGEEGSQIKNLFRIVDVDSDYPYANDNENLFVASSGDKTPTHALKFLVNNVAYWILCCTTN